MLVGIVGILILRDQGNESEVNTPYTYGDITYSSLNRFGSYQEIQDFLTENSGLDGGYYHLPNITGQTYRTNTLTDSSSSVTFSGGLEGNSDLEGSKEHSETNIQVEGVDEGDIVKTDGEYAYVVSGNGTWLFIVKVYPPEDMRIVSIIEVNGTIQEIYLKEDRLIVVGMNDVYFYAFLEGWTFDVDGYCQYYYEPKIFVEVYDIEERENPDLLRREQLNGSYTGSRMIGDILYLILSQYSYDVKGEADLHVPASEILYVDDYDYYYTFTTIMSLNSQKPQSEPTFQVILMGPSTHLYVSQDNIYLTYIKRMSWVEQMERRVEEVILPVLPQNISNQIELIGESDFPRLEKLMHIEGIIGNYTETLTKDEESELIEIQELKEEEFERKITLETEKTIIHKIAIKNGDIRYMASGAVPGYVLNRYSMDEFQEHFRIATTTSGFWTFDFSSTGNHVFVLNLDLKIVGDILNIAPGERIFSARFFGDRAYLVTFERVDPFFVIDLSNPNNPRILGELKITGFSDYLHPYDENHVIGVGREATEEGRVLGVKIALFDVTDVHNPKEISKIIIGDGCTYTQVSWDFHAFLFSKERNLLVIPISRDNWYIYDAFVFDIDLENGLELKGTVSHIEDLPDKDDYWRGYYDSSIKRSFYIEDVLYTVSDIMIKANSLENLNEMNSVELGE